MNALQHARLITEKLAYDFGTAHALDMLDSTVKNSAEYCGATYRERSLIYWTLREELETMLQQEIDDIDYSILCNAR